MSRWMDDQQICASYRDAADRGKQIGILAELNATTPKAITAVLERSGYSVGEEREPPKKIARGEKGKAWTAEEDERLVALHNAGMSGRAISEAMERTRYSVQTRLQVLRRRRDDLTRNKRGREKKNNTQKTEE